MQLMEAGGSNRINLMAGMPQRVPPLQGKLPVTPNISQFNDFKLGYFDYLSIEKKHSQKCIGKYHNSESY